MSVKGTLLITVLTGLLLAPGAVAAGTTTVTISHQMRGCHVWQVADGKPSPTLSVTLKAGTVLRFVDNDVMPHKLIQQAGLKLRLSYPNMSHMSASTSVKLVRKGVYRFTTKAGEDYPSMSSMKTIGEDYVLHLTVHVK